MLWNFCYFDFLFLPRGLGSYNCLIFMSQIRFEKCSSDWKRDWVKQNLVLPVSMFRKCYLFKPVVVTSRVWRTVFHFDLYICYSQNHLVSLPVHSSAPIFYKFHTFRKITPESDIQLELGTDNTSEKKNIVAFLVWASKNKVKINLMMVYFVQHWLQLDETHFQLTVDDSVTYN